SEMEALQKRVEAAEEKVEKAAPTLAERDKKIELLERRLKAQESELNALRRTAGRGAPAASGQVKEIYERAAAGISAAKAELFKQPTPPPDASAEAPEKPAPNPAALRPKAPRRGWEGRQDTKIGALPEQT